MKKKRWFTLLILLFTLSNLFTLNVQAEEEVYSETVSQEYLLEHYAPDESTPVFLNPQFAEAREEIKRGLLNLEDTINIQQFNVPSDEIKNLVFGIIADHPEIFYTTGFSWRYNSNGVISISPAYSDSKDRINTKVRELDLKVNQVLSELIDPSMTEFEKELAIHNYIVLNTRYDMENYLKDTLPQDSYTVYGVLLRGTAVCQGYAESMKLLLNKVGIDAIVVSSPAMNHAWNLVTIDGEKYHVDATWNDPVPDSDGYIGYNYLNISDEDMKVTHQWDYDSYPKATSDTYSFLRGQSSRTAQHIGSYLYYSPIDYQVHRIDLKTLTEKQIPNVRTSSFVVANDWIYFSNATNEGRERIYKAKANGTNLTRLTDTFAGSLEIRDGYLYYAEGPDQVEKKMKIEVPAEPVIPETPEEDAPTIEEGYLDRFKKWVKSFFITPLDSWKIKFSLPLSKASINNENIYVVDTNGRILTDLDIKASDSRTIIVTPEKEYAAGHYYLIIENFESEDGKILSEDIKVEFTVE